MISIRLIAEEELLPGVKIHAADLELSLDEGGTPVYVKLRRGPLDITRTEERVQIEAETKTAFFRALTLMCEHWNEKNFHIHEEPVMEAPGAMLDCSRNAVPTMEGAKTFLRRLSRMGFGNVLLYMEDTYEVPGRPYFGYLRGRFEQRELRELDQYAGMLGIELIPCIQTLGHLARVLHWPCMKERCDTDDVLMVDEEETYELLEEMIRAASAPFQTRRIHIGMDEAYGLGRGFHLDRYGYQSQTELMRRHLSRVREILQKLGLHGMMWSDMYFSMDAGESGFGSAYPKGCVLSEQTVSSAPDDIDLVYWDYYSEEIEIPRQKLEQHARFAAPTIFAGGVYTWTGPVPDFRKARSTSLVTLRACREAGIRQVMATIWGDDGAECQPLLGSLPGLQLFAEYIYRQRVDDEYLSARLKACTGCGLEPFKTAGELNEIGLVPRTGDVVNPVKQLLYEDPLMPLFESDFAGCLMIEHYQKLAEKLNGFASEYPAYAQFFGVYAQISRVLEVKCSLREQAAPIVRSGDRQQAEKLVRLCGRCIEEMEKLAEDWQTMWMAQLRPFGFEVIDIRLGAQIQRLRSAKRRFLEFAEGADLPELTCEKLPYIARKDGTHASLNNWSACAAPTRVSWSV